MKKKLLTLAATALVANTAFGAGAFDGVNAQLGVGMGSISSQTSSSQGYSDASIGGTYSSYSSDNSSSSGKANVFGTASLGYSYGFANKFNLAANVFYMGGSDDAGKYNNSYTNSNGSVETSSGNVTLKDMFGVVVEPGYYFADKSLGFLKLGWAQGKVGISNSSTNNTNVDFPSSSVSASANTQGFLYGLGFKQMLTDNVYLGVEAYQIQFASKSFSNSQTGLVYPGVATQNASIKPLASFAGLTLGYKF